MDALLFRCRGRPAVLLNAEWGAGALPERHAALAASFDVVYCFEPIAVRVRRRRLDPGEIWEIHPNSQARLWCVGRHNCCAAACFGLCNALPVLTVSGPYPDVGETPHGRRS